MQQRTDVPMKCVVKCLSDLSAWCVFICKYEQVPGSPTEVRRECLSLRTPLGVLKGGTSEGPMSSDIASRCQNRVV